MRPRDWLLLLIAYKGAPQGLDPVRLQKGMFLFAMSELVPAEQAYPFEPYNYGPMSKGLYRDKASLVREGLIEENPVAGTSWARYRPTRSGLEAARALLDHLRDDPRRREAARALYDIKQDVAGKSFGQLLTDVYARHPEYATKSVFRRARV